MGVCTDLLKRNGTVKPRELWTGRLQKFRLCFFSFVRVLMAIAFDLGKRRRIAFERGGSWDVAKLSLVLLPRLRLVVVDITVATKQASYMDPRPHVP